MTNGLKGVQVILEGELSSFNESAQGEIVGALATLLRIDQREIRILEIRVGSVILALEMPKSAADRLIALAQQRDYRLSNLGITSIIPSFFSGHLVDFIMSESRRSTAQYLLDMTKETVLSPLEVGSGPVIRKIESILGGNLGTLNEVEAFVLLVATCLPYLLHQFGESADTISSEQVHELLVKLAQDPQAPRDIRTIVREVVPEVSHIANAHAGFIAEDTRYAERYVRDSGVRLRSLAAVLHLANFLNLDQFVDPSLPPGMVQASWPLRLRWWRQAYVVGVSIEFQRLRLHFRLPRGYTDRYRPILVEPLAQKTRTLVHESYDEVLFLIGINLKFVEPAVTEDDLPTIPDDEWQQLKREIESEQARLAEDRIQQDSIRAQRLSELLVSDQVSQAERMAAEGRYIEAAESCARASALLRRERETVQAKKYAVQAAEMYLKGNNRMAAAEQYLQAAEVWLDSALSPELAVRELEQASNLSKEIDLPALRVRVMLAQARAEFALFDDEQAHGIMDQAAELLKSITDKTVRADLTRAAALQHSMLAMVWEKWTLAQEIMEKALADCPEDAPTERMDLLRGLIKVSAEIGDWQTADRAYHEAQQIGFDADPPRRGLLTMEYAASLARRRALLAAHDAYRESLQLFDGHVNAYTLSLAYQNMQHMLVRHGQHIYQDFDTDQARRIDLFHSTQADNIGYAHEMQARADLSAQKYRDALQHIRLALFFYWQQGAWAGIENSYQFLAVLNASTGRPIEALLSAIRGSDVKAAEQYSKIIQDGGNADALAVVVKALAGPRPTASEQSVSAKALAILADVIPPTLLHEVVVHLLGLLQRPEENLIDVAVRRNASEALRKLAAQLSAERANVVVRVALEQLSRQQFWTVTEDLLKLLGDCFANTEFRVDGDMYELVANTVLSFADMEHFRDQAERSATILAHNAPPAVRELVIAHLNKNSDALYRLNYLAFLKEPISLEELSARIETILRSINPRPEVITEGKTQTISIGISAIRPDMLLNFKDILPPALYDRVIDGLLEAVISEHSDLANRADAIRTLSELPTDMLSRRADEIADYLLWGAEGTLPRSSLINMELQSQTDPFSNFRINMGNVEQVRQSSLHALGRLYSNVDPDRRERISDQLIFASRDPHPMVRQGVALALGAIESDSELPTRLLLALVVLLHDSDPRPCSWACAAGAHLIVQGLAGNFAEDLVERLSNLANSSPVVEVRVGAAVGLRLLASSGRIDSETKQRVTVTLSVLSDDVSFRVRNEATRKTHPDNEA